MADLAADNGSGSESGHKGSPPDLVKEPVLGHELVRIPRVVAIRCLDTEVVRRISTTEELMKLPSRVSEKLTGKEERHLTQQARLWLSRRVRTGWRFDPNATYAPGVHGTVVGTRWAIREGWLDATIEQEDKHSIAVPKAVLASSYVSDGDISDDGEDDGQRSPKRRRLSSRRRSAPVVQLLQGVEHWNRQRDAWTQAEHHRVIPINPTHAPPEPPQQQSSMDTRLPLSPDSPQGLGSAQIPSPIFDHSVFSKRVTLLPVPAYDHFIPDNPIRDFRQSAKNNSTIYDAMIIHEKPPWAPIPLGRMVGALVQGWKADGTWTGIPTGVPPESPIAYRKPKEDVRKWVDRVASEVEDPGEGPIVRRAGEGDAGKTKESRVTSRARTVETAGKARSTWDVSTSKNGISVRATVTKRATRRSTGAPIASKTATPAASKTAAPTAAAPPTISKRSSRTLPAGVIGPRRSSVVEDSDPLDEDPNESQQRSRIPVPSRTTSGSAKQLTKPRAQSTTTMPKIISTGVKTRAKTRKRSLEEADREERVELGRMENRLNSLSFEG